MGPPTTSRLPTRPRKTAARNDGIEQSSTLLCPCYTARPCQEAFGNTHYKALCIYTTAPHSVHATGPRPTSFGPMVTSPTSPTCARLDASPSLRLLLSAV